MALIEQPPMTWSNERHITRRGVLWLGLRCDMRCKFCYDELVVGREKAWIPLDEATVALDKVRLLYRNEFVDFMGGEPTLHPKVLEIVDYAASIGLLPTIITHGMHLADSKRVRAFRDAGIHDFLVSIHGIGDTVAAIHGRRKDNFTRQMSALDNLRAEGIPFRFNVTMIRDNLTQLVAIAELAGDKGARVVNFLTFNPYFEWQQEPEIKFQVRHSEIAPFLASAIDRCTKLGLEVNVRYMPPCQLPGREAHVYTGYQLPYDPHEWDYNSWYDAGHEGEATSNWYLEASRRQEQRHGYTHPPGCDECAIKAVCDGLNPQYVARWGGEEVKPYRAPRVSDPCHFIAKQRKIEYQLPEAGNVLITDERTEELRATHLAIGNDRRAGVRRLRNVVQ